MDMCPHLIPGYNEEFLEEQTFDTWAIWMKKKDGKKQNTGIFACYSQLAGITGNWHLDLHK